MTAFPIVVTGATGFLGSRVVRSLSGTRDVIAVHRQPGRIGDRLRYVSADLGPGWTSALPCNATSVIWLAQSRRYQEFPSGAKDMFRVNEAALLDLLEWSREHGVRRFLYASTGSVYESSSRPLSEMSPTAAHSFYAATKLNGENLARQYAESFEVVIARIFALYGAGQRAMAMAKVIAAVTDGRPVPLSGGIGMTFTPLHIDDAVAAVVALLEVSLPERCFVVNLAGTEQVTLAQVAIETGRLTGMAPKLQPIGGEAPSLIADTARLRQLLPNLGSRPLSVGLAATLGAR